MDWRSVTSRYHGSKTSGSPQSFLKEGICIGERWKNSMEYRFVLECSQAQENRTFQSFRFPPYLQHHGLSRSRNFATMATWRNDFSSLLLGSLCKTGFERLTSTGIIFVFILDYFDATKFVFLSVFTIIETICPKIEENHRPKMKKKRRPPTADVRRSKTSLLKLHFS